MCVNLATICSEVFLYVCIAHKIERSATHLDLSLGKGLAEISFSKYR